MTQFRLPAFHPPPFHPPIVDDVTFVHKDGRRDENVRVLVIPNQIVCFTYDISIQVGDSIERWLPSGQIEVLRAKYVYLGPPVGPMGRCYQILCERPEALTQSVQPNAVNVHVSEGSQAHININSTDQSTNINHAQPSPVFDEIRQLLKEALDDSPELELLFERVDDMERNQGVGDFSTSYKDFIASAANHLTLLMPILPALTSLL